jgi:hypothetical protein
MTHVKSFETNLEIYSILSIVQYWKQIEKFGEKIEKLSSFNELKSIAMNKQLINQITKEKIQTKYRVQMREKKYLKRQELIMHCSTLDMIKQLPHSLMCCYH